MDMAVIQFIDIDHKCDEKYDYRKICSITP